MSGTAEAGLRHPRTLLAGRVPVAADSAAGLVSEIATVRTSAEPRNMERAYPSFAPGLG